MTDANDAGPLEPWKVLDIHHFVRDMVYIFQNLELFLSLASVTYSAFSSLPVSTFQFPFK
jgi:hypothetical protein